MVGISLAFWLLPAGPTVYLWALSAAYAVTFVFGVCLLIKSRAVELLGATIAIVPPLLAAGVASAGVLAIGPALGPLFLPLEVIGAAACFGGVYLGLLLLTFRRPTLDLLSVVPGMARFLPVRSW